MDTTKAPWSPISFWNYAANLCLFWRNSFIWDSPLRNRSLNLLFLQGWRVPECHIFLGRWDCSGTVILSYLTLFCSLSSNLPAPPTTMQICRVPSSLSKQGYILAYEVKLTSTFYHLFLHQFPRAQRGYQFLFQINHLLKLVSQHLYRCSVLSMIGLLIPHTN